MKIQTDDFLCLWMTNSQMAPKKDHQRQTKQAATLLLSLPWELLHDGTSYVMMGAKPLTVRRQLVNRKAFDIYVAEPPVRVLLVSPRPEDDAASYIDHRASAMPLVHALDSLGNQAELTILSPPPLRRWNAN